MASVKTERASMKERRLPLKSGVSTGVLLVAPAIVLLLFGFASPLGTLLVESLKEFTPGRVGSVDNAAFTLASYAELWNFAFLDVMWTTFWIGAVSSIIGQVIAFPLAYFIVRQFSPATRTIVIGLLITLILSSVLIKTYAIELTFGSVGILRPILVWAGISPNGRGYINFVVIAGLLHSIIPIATLTLVGAVQSLDPRLVDAAQSLGAPPWKAHLTVTFPLAAPAIVSSALVSLTFAISAFVIPMVLGRGRVLFMSNVIYTRFSDIANYPSGASISIVMLVAALAVITLVSVSRRQRETR
jgi:putative spermidine/putrescine transport system permease protein